MKKPRFKKLISRLLFLVIGLICFLLASRAVESLQATMNRHVYAQRTLDSSSNIPATNYYVSPSGDDANAGTSPAKAWRTLSQVNRFSFRPGDRILLEGGQSFDGGLRFDSDDVGIPVRPITVSSYGQGRAIIAAGNGYGIYIHNTMGFDISNLTIVGSGRTTNTGSGVFLNNDLAGDIKLKLVRIDQVEVSGFGNYGILIDGNKGKSGYRDVRITNAVAHDNALAGIYVQGEFSQSSTAYAHEDIYIGYSRAYKNSGVSGTSRQHSGSGIVISDVDGGIVERSVVYENGWLCNSNQGGPVGIWAWDSNNITLQYNESYRNRTDSKWDGGGLDLDGGVTNSVMQYNYSHDNDGSGYLLAQFPYARKFTGNTVRYNISQNDGRKNSYGAIYLFGEIHNSEVYNNTIYLTPPANGSPLAVNIHKDSTTNVHFRNNIFQTTGGLRLIEIASGQTDLLFQGNDYFSSSAELQIRWLGKNYNTLKAWRSATGQERVKAEDVGLSVDPKLLVPGKGDTFNNAKLLDTLSSYRLQNSSPLIEAGLNLRQLFALDPGTRDYYGNRLPQGAAFDVGAHEFEAKLSRSNQH